MLEEKHSLINLNSSPCLPSNTRFGLFFSMIFAAIALYYYIQGAESIFLVTPVILFIVFFFATFLAPEKLAMPNRIWYEFGMLLGKMMNPIVLGFIFFLIITPTSLITRLFGRDNLKIKKSSVLSYWIERSPSGPLPESFKDQF